MVGAGADVVVVDVVASAGGARAVDIDAKSSVVVDDVEISGRANHPAVGAESRNRLPFTGTVYRQTKHAQSEGAAAHIRDQHERLTGMEKTKTEKA